MVIFIGRSVGTIDAFSYVVDGVPRPVQSAVLIDPGSGNRPTRFNNEVIPLSSGVAFPLSAQTSSVPNGTRLGNLVQMPQCLIGSDNYDGYLGTVE